MIFGTNPGDKTPRPAAYMGQRGWFAVPLAWYVWTDALGQVWASPKPETSVSSTHQGPSVAYGNVTPVITSNAHSSFGVIPAGLVKVSYVRGAMRYSNTRPNDWQVNRFTDDHEFKIVTASGEINAPGNEIVYANQAACEAGNAGLNVEFDHAGGDVSMYLFDNPYDDNLPGSPNPTFSLSLRPNVTVTEDARPKYACRLNYDGSYVFQDLGVSNGGSF